MATILNDVSSLRSSVAAKGRSGLDSIFPPDQRAAVMKKMQAFAVANPKLSAFLLANIVLTGIPLVLFTVFTLTVFVFSLVVALLIGFVAALLFTLFAAGIALLFIIPTVFTTTFAASFIFIWASAGYYILRWFNDGQDPTEEGTAIGDMLNSLTGGRLGWLMESARDGGTADKKTHLLDGNRNYNSSEKNEQKSSSISGSDKLNAGGTEF